jgi:hypothetical protein
MILKNILYFLLIQYNLSIKPEFFCILTENIENEVRCKAEQCGNNLCSIDYKSCENLNNWFTIVNKYIKELKNLKLIDQFLEKINECQPNEYISLKKQICSIEAICSIEKKFELSQLYKPFKFKTNKSCNCTGQNKIKCGNNYCTDNKYTCAKVINSLNDSTFMKHINKC